MLSVVIPYYRQRRCLELTLKSLAAQTLPATHFEVLVVDDDSGEDIQPIIESFGDHIDIRLIQQPVNRGRAATRNRGAAEARGHRVHFLDADSYAAPDLLEKHARFHRAHPEKVLLGARVETDWGVTHGVPTTPPTTRSEYGADMRYKVGLDPATFEQCPIPWLWGYTHNMSLPTEAFEKCGGFDEAFTRWGHEDVEFAYRLFVAAGRRLGYFRFDPTALCFHVPHFRKDHVNWFEADAATPYITGKHRSIEFEFFEEGAAGMSEALPTYLSRLDYLTTHVDHLGVDEIAAALPPVQSPGRLVIGPSITQHFRDDASVELVEHARISAHTGPANVGMRLPIAQDRFADVVNIDVWRVLSPVHLSRLVIESLRIGRALHLGYSTQLPWAADAGFADDPGHICDMLASHARSRLREVGPRSLVIEVQRH